MNPIDQKIEGALEQVTLSQDAKYRIKNKVKAFPAKHNKRIGGKLSSAAFLSIVLASLIFITAAAAVGFSLFKGIYGEKAETLTPYGVTIGTSVQNGDVQLTLHESVADDYATAYIFSIKGLTDAGKALVASNTLDPNADETVFRQTNKGETLVKTVLTDNYPTTSVEKNPPKENADCQLYELHQQTDSDGEYVYFDIGLRRNNVMYNAENNASYVIIPIESLREESREYFALYIITPEVQQLTLTFNGLELSLPQATTYIPGTEVIIDGYIQDYMLTEGGLVMIMYDYPTSAVLTPLGLYVNDNHARSLAYRYASLTFNDGSEQYLSEISNDKSGIASWKPRYLPTHYQGAVYLFNEIMDISTVKSLVFSDEIEFPFDGSAPFVRSSGRILDPNDPQLLYWKITAQIRDYIIENCPESQYVRKTGFRASDFSCSYEIIDNGSVNDNNCKFIISFSRLSGGTLEEEARAKVESIKRGINYDLSFNVAGTGVYNGTDVLVVECGETSPGLYKRCIFAFYEGKLLTIEYDGYTGQPTDYAFDALLNLIKFD
ncbi:MAG TPA: DUF4179 domain-containing protein [Oscillospiraceae bacterium]|nr:DUF4179 domain-containing protein [Oscillospiraceae bacterium]HPS34188.1 DUF4179 domain-containing protein [Oscillospiraceae bacterium]